MTQEKLAAMSKVNQRTVQRAEGSASLQLDTLASLAATLRVTTGELTRTDADSDGVGQTPTSESNTAVLRQITSGKVLIDLVCGSFSGELCCAAEPTEGNIDALTNMVERIERLIPNPWETPMEAERLTLAQRLREALAITVLLGELEKLGIAVFAGTYTAGAQVPRYDMDEGHMYIRGNQRFEPVTVCRVNISPAGGERVVMRVADKWQDQAHSPSRKINDDDDIPF